MFAFVRWLRLPTVGVGRSSRAIAALFAALVLAAVAAPTALAVAPTVTINQSAAQADPTSTSPIEFTASFSQPVTGFTGSDVVVAGTAHATTAVTSDGPSVWTVKVTGMTATGSVTVSIPAGAATNASSQGNTASTSTDSTVTFQKPAPTVPTVTINQAFDQADPTGTSPIRFTASFSEPVSGFDKNDVDLSQSTAGGTLEALPVTGGPSVYTVSIAGMTTPGTVVVGIPAGAATDAASTSNAAATWTDRTVTWNSSITPVPTPTATPTPTTTPTSTPVPTATPVPPGQAAPTPSPAPGSGLLTTPAPIVIPVPLGPAALALTPACTAKAPCSTTTGGKAIVFSATCTGSACSGTVAVKHTTPKTKHAKAKTTTLGSLAINLSVGTATQLTVPLTAAARTLLRPHKHVTLTLATTLAGKTTTRAITIGLPSKAKKTS